MIIQTTAFGLTWAQLSPGPLHRAHEHLEGLKNCTQCHEVGSTTLRDRCLECHQLLAQKLESEEGWHATITDQRCRDCHKDHQGRDFAMVWWKDGQPAFDHDGTGFALDGKHRESECRSCHQAKFILDPEPIRAASKDLDRTFFGLEPNCANCHEDAHRGQLGDDCQACHDANGWRDPPHFDHQSTHFPLVGAHAKVECRSCHPQQSDKPGDVSFKGIAFDTCRDCHRDPHDAQFQRNCESCHDEIGWKPASRFDHDRARYTIQGAHLSVDCARCHPKQNGITRFRPITHDDCISCHQDPHRGKFQDKCSQCHSTQSWSRVAEFDHDLTDYPLTGRHETVTCAKCHSDGTSKPLSGYDRCGSCHEDIHMGQFKTQLDCKGCHSVEGFRPSSFGMAEHESTSFPLEGSHRAVPCVECHQKVKRPHWPRATQQFDFADHTCQGCHQDPHRDAFAGERPTCDACHTQHDWAQSEFDHGLTNFHLTGRHLEVACRSCHVVAESLRFSLTEKRCEACHDDIHQAQFADNITNQVNCDTCHVTRDWFAERFDHATMSTFALDGSHRGVACEACHPQVARQGVLFTRYKPIDANCSTCHDPTER